MSRRIGRGDADELEICSGCTDECGEVMEGKETHEGDAKGKLRLSSHSRSFKPLHSSHETRAGRLLRVRNNNEVQGRRMGDSRTTWTRYQPCDRWSAVQQRMTRAFVSTNSGPSLPERCPVLIGFLELARRIVKPRVRERGWKENRNSGTVCGTQRTLEGQARVVGRDSRMDESVGWRCEVYL